jgi:hypothetical protein
MADRYAHGIQQPLRLVEKELSANLGNGNFIFVGSSCDMFADAVDNNDISRVVRKCETWAGKNTYLFHTKNPANTLLLPVRDNFVLCATIESDRWHDAMGNAPLIGERLFGLRSYNGRKMITVEPIMDFDVEVFAELIKISNVEQVNIGADSGNNRLPEPPPEKIAALVGELRKFAHVRLKKNLGRLYKEAA